MRRWHEGRARGQLERIERVEDCGSEHFNLACKQCGVVDEHVHDRTCASWRYCVECRGRRARRARERFRLGRDAWLASKRDYERDRFLTLTIPHGGIAGDVRVLLDSWVRLCRSTRSWFTRRYGAPRFTWMRAVEITPSDGGHVHLHAWVGSPFLPHAVLRVLWGRALSTDVVPVRHIADVLAELPDERSRAELLRVAGWRGRRACDGSCVGSRRRCYLRHWVPWPVLDIRAVHGDPADELVKYLIKDVDAHGLVDPLVAANLIEATEGTRVVASSRGFVVVELVACEHCAEPVVYMVLRVAADPAESSAAPRGPPRLRSYSALISAEVASVCSEPEPF